MMMEVVWLVRSVVVDVCDVLLLVVPVFLWWRAVLADYSVSRW